VEQQLAAGLGQGQIAEFVENEEVEPGEAIGDAALSPGARFGLQSIPVKVVAIHGCGNCPLHNVFPCTDARDRGRGFVFGREAAEGALFGEIAKLVGPDSASAVQAMLRSASSTRSGIIATVVGIGTLIATATAVFSELQAALNLIWKVPAAGNLGVTHFLKSRFLSLCVILVIGFLLLVSLVASTVLEAFSDYIDRTLPNFSFTLYLVHYALSFGFTTVFFAVIFKVLPDHPVEWQDVWLSAAMTSLLFSVGKHLISLYIGSSNMASSYGAASALIIVFVWVYYSAQIFLLGAEFAKAYGDWRRTEG